MHRTHRPRFRKAEGGFTLVEMSLVLVVIGLILGGVSIGKDIQRNAEYTKIKQKFIDPWVSAYNAYYLRAGVVLGDSQVQPRMMVNGSAYDAAALSPISGQDMTNVTPPSAICEGALGPNMAGTDPNLILHQEMDRHGVRMPPGRAEGSEDRYVYLDSNGNPQEVQVCFQWNIPGDASNSGNVMIITGLTPDLARSLDQMIDGKADAQEGLFRQQTVDNGTAGAPGLEWAANNTENYDAAGSSAPTSGGNDEDQVNTVVAVYKMNQ